MQLFIAEKPELAKAIVSGLDDNFSSHKGYYKSDSTIVTWCFGHMMQLCEPDEYDPKYAKWNIDDLPFCFIPVKRKPNPKTVGQLNIILDLISKADSIVNAGDPDEEGQSLVDEIIREANYTKPVFRVLINDNNSEIVARAIANMEDNKKFEHLGFKAEARSIADQYFGYNLSRLYTLRAQAYGSDETLSVGRVQTPILGLVVRRDRLNESHISSYYYNVLGQFKFNDFDIEAKYIVDDSDITNEKKKLIDLESVKRIAARANNKAAKLIEVNTTKKTKKAPLPYNIIKLQQSASKKWGYKPTEVDTITQTLREKHKLITYNRSDCQYLSEEQHSTASSVLDAISANVPGFNKNIAVADPSIKGKAYNSSKVSAHHAIIPTSTKVDFNLLTEAEANIYKMLATAFIAQFYDDYKYDETKIVFDVDGLKFGLKSKVEIAQGWRKLYNDANNNNKDSEDEIQNIDLRSLQQDSNGICNNVKITKHKTTPPKLYTMDSLLGSLTKVSNYIKDENLAKLLKERDKDKEGESGGIGTPATRANIIQSLFDRGFLIEKGKNIVSTELARMFYDQLNPIIVYPDMTAIWYEQQKTIRTIDDVYKFVENVMNQVVNPEVNRLKNQVLKVPTYDCSKCGRKLRRMPGKNGFFWGCEGFKDATNQCNNILDDIDGKPGIKKKKKKKSFRL